MLKQLFPDCIDNRFHGHILSVWLVIPIAFSKVLSGFLLMKNSAQLAMHSAGNSIMGVSEPSFVEMGSTLAQSGLQQLFFGLIFIVILFKYRSMLPLLYSLLLMNLLAGELGIMYSPVSAFTIYSPYLAKAISLMYILGFVLSIHADRPISQQFAGES